MKTSKRSLARVRKSLPKKQKKKVAAPKAAFSVWTVRVWGFSLVEVTLPTGSARDDVKEEAVVGTGEADRYSADIVRRRDATPREALAAIRRNGSEGT